MAYDYDLKRFKEQVSQELSCFAGPRSLKLELIERIVSAYEAGYAQCEQDYRTELGI